MRNLQPLSLIITIILTATAMGTCNGQTYKRCDVDEFTGDTKIVTSSIIIAFGQSSYSYAYKAVIWFSRLNSNYYIHVGLSFNSELTLSPGTFLMIKMDDGTIMSFRNPNFVQISNTANPFVMPLGGGSSNEMDTDNYGEVKMKLSEKNKLLLKKMTALKGRIYVNSLELNFPVSSNDALFFTKGITMLR